MGRSKNTPVRSAHSSTAVFPVQTPTSALSAASGTVAEPHSAPAVLIRVRHPAGCVRLSARPEWQFEALEQAIQAAIGGALDGAFEIYRSVDPLGRKPANDPLPRTTVHELGLQQGEQLHAVSAVQKRRHVEACASAGPARKKSKRKSKNNGTEVGKDSVADACHGDDGGAGSTYADDSAASAGVRTHKLAGESSARGAFDAQKVAREFLYPPDTGPLRSAMGFKAHCEFSAAARLDAVEHGTFVFGKTPRRAGAKGKRGVKSGLPWLQVQYVSQRRKPVVERVPHFNSDQLVQIFAAVMGKSTTRRRRSVASTSHILNSVAIANRAPPLFWSAVHAYWQQQHTASMSTEGDSVQPLEPELCFTGLVHRADALINSQTVEVASFGADTSAGEDGGGVQAGLIGADASAAALSSSTATAAATATAIAASAVPSPVVIEVD